MQWKASDKRPHGCWAAINREVGHGAHEVALHLVNDPSEVWGLSVVVRHRERSGLL